MRTIKRIVLLVAVILLHSTHTLFAQNLSGRIDSIILKEFKDPNGPGGEFMVAQNGNPFIRNHLEKRM